MTKCYHCKKKIKIVEYTCKCTTKKFCNICSAPEDHNCSFDFVAYQKEKLENKLVKVEKAKITAI